MNIYLYGRKVSRNTSGHLTEAGTYPQLPTQPFFLITFKPIQQSNMVILSCPAKKNQNLNLRIKSSVYYWKGGFVGVSGLKTQLSVINWTFFPSNSNFDVSSRGYSEWPY